MTGPSPSPRGLGGIDASVAFMVAAMFLISVNDMVIKLLSGDYPLHQMIFARSAIGIVFTIAIVQLEGGWSILRTNRPWLHALRAGVIVLANVFYFMALVVMPLADATALFFVAPLFITLLSIPVLGERVGPRRLGAVLVGFLGVLVMLRPGGALGGSQPFWVLLLPVAAAFCYAVMQVLTRKLRVSSKASAMAFYIQVTFIAVSGSFFLATGDGRFAEGLESESLRFLVRAWVWPEPGDLWLFLLLGMVATGIGYSLSQAYRLGEAATVAVYEYVALPLAVFWGWLVFSALPGAGAAAGIAMIGGAGIYVFLRSRAVDSPVRAARHPGR